MRILIVWLLLISSFSFASWNGTYEGDAIYKNSTGIKEYVPLQIEVRVKDGLLSVTERAEDWILFPRYIEIRGYDLYYKGNRIGSISDTEIIVKEIEGKMETLYSLNIKRLSPKQIEYNESATWPSKVTSQLKATLTKIK